MAYGTITVDQADVLIVLSGGTTQPSRPTTRPRPVYRPPVRLRPKARWNINQATHPEPIVFMLTRQMELLGDEINDQSIRRRLEQWRIALHDGKRKVGKEWLSRDEQRRGRSEVEKRLTDARRLMTEARRYARSTKPGDKARRNRLERDAVQALYSAAGVWPDTTIQDFMIGSLDLQAGRYEQAEQRFSSCIDAQPLVAGYHQGRGLALIKLGRPLEALEEFIACFHLRDDSALAFQLVEEAMKVTPGSYMKDPVYVRAKELLGRYEKPKQQYRRYGKGTVWLMPGRRTWQARDETLFTPEFDRIVSKQALGIPISENVLLVDEQAIADAELIYVELGPRQVVRATAMRRSYGSLSGSSEVPVSAIRVSGVALTPVEADKPVALKPGQSVTIRAVNLHRQMGTEIRAGHAKVIAAGPEGVKLEPALLPGEAVGAAFVGEAIAGLLTSRCQGEQEGCGKSSFIKPADLAERVKRIKQSLAYGGGFARGPKLKKDLPKTAADGRVFLVHILALDKPPQDFGK